MSTYRKFDKYRQRADFLVDLEHGVDTPANKWVNAGTGTPVLARTVNGLSLATSAGGTATSYIQRGIISAATRTTVLKIERDKKFHIVASANVSGLGDGRIILGFAGANADPMGQDRIVLIADAGGFSAQAGVNGAVKEAELPANLDDYAVNDVLDLEVYYDGKDHIQFYAGRKRVLKLEVPTFTTELTPTVGIQNNGEASVHTVVFPIIGYAVQRNEPRDW